MLLRQICYVLIIYGLRCHASVDYYDDYEEISVDLPVKIMTNNLIKMLEDDEEKLKLENDVIKTQLETMSNTFRKTINKIKMKHKRIDILFLVDSSSSVGKENFVNEISFVKRLLSDFNVSYNYTRVALITFSSRGKIHLHINQISEPSIENDKCVLLNHQIPLITYSGGGTSTALALLKAKDVFDNSTRMNSKKIIVLITDGFSNGRNPIAVAHDLKQNNVLIFTVGISSGNYNELKSIASKPSENYNYMLSSFSLFESLARKALHTDYKTGIIVPVKNTSFCDSLCENKTSAAESCCDTNAECACGFHSGHYSCICNPGYYGTGLKGSCDRCPTGSYWNFWNSCFNCPDINHETIKTPAMSINDCKCKSGYKSTEANRCEIIKCPSLAIPGNGYFVQSTECGNTVNAACGARCKSGYQLLGSSIRLCQENGTWSGIESECILKTCPKLVVPFYGVAICRNPDLNMNYEYSPRNETFMKDYNKDVQKYTEDFPIDTECSFSCAHGYSLVGSQRRHCLPLSKWDGLQTSCKQILCQPLPSVPFGVYDKTDCSEQKSAFGTNCTLSCEHGFELKGPITKSCGGARNGVWTQKNKIPRCVDVTPPIVVCPKNYTIELIENKSYVLLKNVENLEHIEDNSKSNISFWTKPALKPENGTKLSVGNYTFTYVAVDDFKNKAKCNFSIAIIDKTPPKFENCIQEQTFYVPNKINKDISIEWIEPLVFDNADDKNITILRSLTHGFLDAGEHKANYTAVDKSGNQNDCIITVIVKEKKCEDLAAPENGQRICAKNGTLTWCDFRCNFGYGITENDLVIENVLLFCDNENRTWTKDIPECTIIEQPNSVEEIMTISMQSDYLHCEDFTKNQDQILKSLKDELCGDQIDCEFTTELPVCIDEDISNEISNSSFYNIVKRDTQSQVLKKNGTKLREKNTVKVELYVKVSKTLGIWKNNTTKSENIKQVKEELKKVNTSDRLKKRLRNMNVDLSSLKLDEMIKCNVGSVPKKLVCAQCPRGTFHNIKHHNCTSCPYGTFNNLTGQSSCQKCPEFFSTRKINTRLESDCRQMCKPGTYARIKEPKIQKINETIMIKTLMPFCRSCNVGEYQSLYDQTVCEKCPEGFKSERGSKSLASCYLKKEKFCNENVCENGGICIPKDKFYHCECTDSFTGMHCEILQDPCSSSPCFNGGICKYFNQTAIDCHCPSSFFGTYCESIHDPCSQKVCLNGGACNDFSGSAYCDCAPGFEGENCETFIPIDHCYSSPCVSGICTNTIDGFECFCEPGVIGKRCHLKPCDYFPCPENGICVNLDHPRAAKESYYCKCPIGIKGALCDEVDNPCDKIPCKNNARCVPTLLRDPKKKRLTTDDVTESMFEEYSCKCPPFFYGETCELFTTPDFVLEFEKSSVNNYVKMTGPDYDLKEISFCSWIQTNDSFNYGSLISYATLEQDNVFTFTDYNGFVLYLNGANVITDIKIIDDVWHFVCVSWTMTDGFYEIYLDGELHVQGYNLSRSIPIAKNGVFIIGQEQDYLGGGFSETESFVGKVSYLDFWNRQLTSSEVNEYYRTCEPYFGSLYSWTDLKFKTVGNIKVLQSEFCKPCAQSLQINNAKIIYGEQTAFVQCDQGFKLQGSPMVQCLRTSQWDSKLPSCVIIRCAPLKTPANGKINVEKISYAGVAKFSCDDGFNLIGSDMISCTLHGNWSDVIPNCKSIFECPPLPALKNGNLVYATDSGIIAKTIETQMYPVGTFVEIKCNAGFFIEGENLISCTENGIWDYEIEECSPDPNSPAVVEHKTELFEMTIKDFWKEFKTYLFYSCQPKNMDKLSKLCAKYVSDFEDSSSFDLPENPEYKGMDSKLLKLLKVAVESDDLENVTVETFMKFLLYASGDDEQMDPLMEDSYRFVICLYMDLILMDVEFSVNAQEFQDNINERLKSSLKLLLAPAYQNYLKISSKFK